LDVQISDVSEQKVDLALWDRALDRVGVAMPLYEPAAPWTIPGLVVTMNVKMMAPIPMTIMTPARVMRMGRGFSRHRGFL
jgi:hypothetical protein